MHPSFYYKNNELYCEEVSLSAVATQFGTPCYVYSRALLEENYQAFETAFGNVRHRICYAVKANSNIAILNIFAKKNAGFDIVSVGELERVLAAQGDPKKIVFSGVAKQEVEIERALAVGIGCFNIESEPELERIQTIAERQQKIANVALRINPNIDARTHPYIATGLSNNKFGIDYTEAWRLCQKIQSMSHLKLVGIGCHIGSQLTELEPFLEAIDLLLELLQRLSLAGIQLEHVDIGGGLGVCYSNETPPSIADYVKAISKKLENCPLEIIIEPGRVLVADAGILLTRLEYLKHTPHKNFAITDVGMNDLLRPALYDAWHEIIPVKTQEQIDKKQYDIVGPVCESADFLGKNRQLALTQGDLLAIFSAGAYGFSMSSNYNSRPKAAEVMIDKNKMHLIRRRESIEDLFASESLIT